MALPSSGAISFSQINVELGVSATATRSLNDSTTRTLFGVPSGQISMSQGYGKANQFSFTIASNQTNANLRTLAVNAGWNQSSKVVATINSGVYIYSTSTGTPALTVNGSFPGGVELVNNGTIQGMGGAGGRGGNGTPQSAGSVGNSGGLALSVSVAVSINNVNRIAGGGGGGGGGGGAYSGGKTSYYNAGGGGGGGLGGGAGGAAGTGSDNTPYAGTSGTLTSNGNGGAGGTGFTIGGTGGAGGTYGSAGSQGQIRAGTTPGGGGAAGGCVTGNGNITWIAVGTRNGGIS